jgi:protein TonB
MHTLPAININQFNPIKLIAMISVAILITFVLFVGMQKMIQNDQITRPKIIEYPIISLTLDIDEKPTNTRPRIKPQPIPVTKPKLVTKIVEAEPNAGIDPALLAFNYSEPVIRNDVKPDFNSAGGDARPIVRVEPKYPTSAARDGVEGWVKLSFSITPSGAVANVQVVAAEPKRVFNQAAKRALAKWTYKPNIQAGKAQAQDGMMVMLDFKLAS